MLSACSAARVFGCTRVRLQSCSAARVFGAVFGAPGAFGGGFTLDFGSHAFSILTNFDFEMNIHIKENDHNTRMHNYSRPTTNPIGHSTPPIAFGRALGRPYYFCD